MTLLAKPAIAVALRVAKVALPILALLALALYIGSLRGDLRSANKKVESLTEWRLHAMRATLDSVRLLDPKRKTVTADGAADDIRWLGREGSTHRAALAKQSAALVKAKGEAAVASNAAKIAREAADKRDQGRQATRGRLLAPERATGLTTAEWGEL